MTKPKRHALKRPALTQAVLDLPAPPVRATGDTWTPDAARPATVPLANDVLIREVCGPYTEIDRKLWVLLVHAAWDDLNTQRLHEARPSQINALFKKLRGRHDSTGAFEIWQSIRRLTKTSLDFVDEDGAENSTNLINAKLHRATDRLYYGFPEQLLDLILANKRFSRLRLHFMIGLSGKYAVSLYVALERVANQKHPVVDVTIPELRSLLQVPEGKMKRWVDLKRFGILSALQQINEGAEQGGFTVKMEEIVVGRGVERVRFVVKKTESRALIESRLTDKKPAKTRQSSSRRVGHIVDLDVDKAMAAIRKHAPGFDAQMILREWEEWSAEKPEPENQIGALVNFTKRKYKEMKHEVSLFDHAC
jgi:hypothetical protein